MNRRAPAERRPIDWEAARRRLAVAEQTPAALAAAAAQILQDRAVRLAATPGARESEQSSLEVLSFERNGRHYAIESRFVVEVGKCGRLSAVPGAQRVLLGVTNLRGDVLPVFDLALVTDSGSEPPLSPQLLVLGRGLPDFGVLADSVDQVSRLPLASLTTVGLVGALPHPEYIQGITADARVLLDGDAVLKERRVFVATTVSGSVPRRN
jgi:purine-binding chemotaxis protein CheW